jgi:hypothetical protein
MTNPRDWPSPESVAHLKKKVENCWNYEQEPGRGKIYHKLELVDVVDKRKAGPDMPLDRAFVLIGSACKTCGQLYSQQFIPVSRADLLAAHGLRELARNR